MLIRNTVLFFVTIYSLSLFALENETGIFDRANQLYEEELYLEAATEYKKLISSKSNYYKAQAYLGLGNSNYWLEDKEAISLQYYDILLEDKILFLEVSKSSRVDLYNSVAWLNSFFENYPYSFRYDNLAVQTYEKYFNEQSDEYPKNLYCTSLYNLAISYHDGLGAKQSYKDAYENFLKSSDKCNDSESLNYLGVMHEQGTYVDQNFKKASEWYIKGMDHEIPSLWSKINYGYLLANGFGVPKNIELAIQFYDEVINTKEYVDLVNVQDLAKEYKELLNSNNDSIKSLNYVDSFICKDIQKISEKGQDVSKSFQLCLENAEKNNSSSQYYMGFFYENGIGVRKNLDIAVKWYSKASKNLDGAKFNLAKIIQQGRTSLFSMDKAISLFLELQNHPLEKNSDKNYVIESTYELGIIYLHGVGVDKNLEKTKKYFHELIDTNNIFKINAQKQLDIIKAIKAGFATESNVVKYFPAEFSGLFRWENNSETVEIQNLVFNKITQVGVTHYNLSGFYIDDNNTKVQLNGFMDSNYNHVEIWESDPINTENSEKITVDEFQLNGSYVGFFDKDFSSINAHWIPHSSGLRGVLQLERTNKIKNTVKDFELIKNVNFGKYFALVIGNNDYEYMKPSLEMAVADANAVSEVLKNKYGFEIIDTIINGDYKRIMAALNNLKNIIQPYDNLLIYYAGHGYQDTDVGYWIPIDGADPIDDDDTYWIDTQKISRTVSKISAKHILIVADSCYSGTLIDRGTRSQLNNNIDYYTNLLNKKTRRALTSGANEPVVDGGGEGHSVFANAFLTILSNKNNILTTSELYNELVKEVAQKVSQTPQYGTISKAGDEGGDFIFVPIN